MLSTDSRSPTSGQERKYVGASNTVQSAAILCMGKPINRAIQLSNEDLLLGLDGWISVYVCLLLHQRRGRQ